MCLLFLVVKIIKIYVWEGGGGVVLVEFGFFLVESFEYVVL